MSALNDLAAVGQAPWLDLLRRSLIAGGMLTSLIDKDGVTGLTSNPSIFEKAIGAGDEYADAIREYRATGDHTPMDIYEHLAIADIQSAADLFRPVYDQTQRRDGYVSLECSPYLANDAQATVAEARRLWRAVSRPNLMVKVPATASGLVAIRQLIGEGLNVNITLLFSVETYEAVVEAYLGGLEEFHTTGGDVDSIGSVASFFVSRIDGAVKSRLDALGDRTAALDMHGKIAVANAKVAYARYQNLFSGQRWQALADKGARPQRLHWASTGVKDPLFHDTYYVEELIGRDTVDTLPMATLDAFRDHGRVRPDRIQAGLGEAHADLAKLAALGVDLSAVTDELVVDGLQQFTAAFDRLLAGISDHPPKKE